MQEAERAGLVVAEPFEVKANGGPYSRPLAPFYANTAPGVHHQPNSLRSAGHPGEPEVAEDPVAPEAPRDQALSRSFCASASVCSFFKARTSI